MVVVRLRPYRLSEDLRLKFFARVFAFGTISHVLEFLIEQSRVGPVTEYMERWTRIIPSVGWSSRTGLALHGATTVVSILLLIAPHSRELLSLLAGFFLFSELASPERIASHCSMMTGGMLVILLLAIAEWIDLAMRRREGSDASKEWYAWTLVGLQWICALTYFFAFFYKLNPHWFSPNGKAPGFLIRPLEPFMRPLGIAAIASVVLGPIAVYGTLAIELVLPILLFFRRTRLIGGFIGIVFSLGMVGQGVADFPILIVAFYATFLSLDEARELAKRFCARPTVIRIIGTALLVSVWVVQDRSRENWMYRYHDDPQIMAIYKAADLVSFIFLSYLAVVLGEWLWKIRLAAMDAAGHRDIASPRWSWSKGLSAAVVILVAGGFIYNNLAGFFALPFFGPMYMFSGINADLSDHYVLSRRPLTGAFDFVLVTKFVSSDQSSPAAREFRSFARWSKLQTHPVELNLNEIRYLLSRVCDATPKPIVKLSVMTRAGEQHRYDDVCTESDLLWYIPLPVASACDPRCIGELARRARREFRQSVPDSRPPTNPDSANPGSGEQLLDTPP